MIGAPREAPTVCSFRRTFITLGSRNFAPCNPYNPARQKRYRRPGYETLPSGWRGINSAMTPAAAIFGGLAVLFTVCALLPVGASACFGERAAGRLATSIGAIAGLVLLMACALWTYLPRISLQLSEEERHLTMFVVFIAGVPALFIYLGTLAGYIAMGFIGSAHEED